jgi:hypothetical protein
MWLLWAALALAQSPERATGSLTKAERAALEMVLAPCAGLEGADRVAYLEAQVGQSDSAAVNAAIARALAVAYDVGADHDAVRDAALDQPDPMTEDILAATRAYDAQRFEIREETELRGGGSTLAGGSWGSPMGSTVVTNPVYTVRGWGIYQGHTRLTVPEYLDRTGQVDLALALNADIERSRWQARALYGAGGVGLAATLVGLIGAQTTNDPTEFLWYRRASAAGSITAIAGFIGGSVPSARAQRLETDPSYRFTPDQVQPHLDRANESLRQELDLSPHHVLQIERASLRPWFAPGPGNQVAMGVHGRF